MTSSPCLKPIIGSHPELQGMASEATVESSALLSHRPPAPPNYLQSLECDFFFWPLYFAQPLLPSGTSFSSSWLGKFLALQDSAFTSPLPRQAHFPAGWWMHLLCVAPQYPLSTFSWALLACLPTSNAPVAELVLEPSSPAQHMMVLYQCWLKLEPLVPPLSLFSF